MVVANMIGTGIFTSLGFQVMPAPVGIPDAFAILFIWFLGGILALCGAVSYGEVATTLKDSGGEYTFLSRLYHPLIGFTSGWVSLIAGFSAAVSALAIAAANYALPVLADISGGTADEVTRPAAISFILLVAAIQSGGIRMGSQFQNLITAFKLLLIVFILCLPLFAMGEPELASPEISFLPGPESWNTIFSLPFAGSLVFVMFSYSGWNASSYITGNLENPRKDLPFSLVAGTAIVALIYVLMNGVFMSILPFSEIDGQIALGNLTVARVFGFSFAKGFGFIFSFALLSGISAMFIAGPRVAEQIGNDYPVFSFLKRKNAAGAPVNAIGLQTLISVCMVWFFQFEVILQYIEITLSLFCLLTVAGVFIIRHRNLAHEGTVKTALYPFTPLLFSGITLWMMAYFFIREPERLTGTAITLASGAILYFLFRKK